MSENSKTILKVKKLRTCFYADGEELPAVDGISFTVQRGKTLALVGESGCGKSVTALSLLRLIDRPGKIVGGEITFFPANSKPIKVTSLKAKDRLLYKLRGGLIGMVFQEPMTALSPVYTIGSQISEALFLHRSLDKKNGENKVCEMLHKVGIPNPRKVYHQYPHEISGGMRQRAVIAMALISNPQLLIADEPTTALDVTIQAQILSLIKKLQEEMNISVLLITHDIGVVAQVADNVAVMYIGKIVESAPIRELIKSPCHPYTIALLESIPGLNTKSTRLASIQGSVPSLKEIPNGCPFHPRCKYAIKGICDTVSSPSLTEITDQHYVACFRAGEICKNG